MKQQAGKQFYKLIVIAWLTFSLGSVILALVSWSQLSARMDAGRQIVQTRDALQKTFQSVLDLETGERGYVITGDKAFLEPFDTAKTNLLGQFKQLTALAHNDPALLNGIGEFRADAGLLLNSLDETIQLRGQSMEKAVEAVSGEQGKNLMDRIRSRNQALEHLCAGRQMAIRAEIFHCAERANVATLVAGIFGIGAGLVALWLSYVTLRHQERERSLVEAKLSAEHSNHEKTIFLANVSHEIRTPMNAILGFSELLDGEMQIPRHRQYLQSIRSSAHSLLQLINDILDMSKIEAGVMELRPEPTDLHEVCDFVRALFIEPAARKDIALQCRIAPDIPRSILMDRIRLRQILVNLVGNAIKFTDRGSIEIRVFSEKEPDQSHITLIIEVQDTGVGVPKDKLDAIFKPFVQSGAHQDKEKQGTGLGLAIVKRLTEILGGTVTVASVIGQGSAFHLRFRHVPISARLSTPEKLSNGAEVDFNELRPASFLVVDDNQTNCDLVAGMFAGSHHRLHFAANGQDAIGRAREGRPDIVLMDIRMPGMSGMETLAAIRKIAGLEMVPGIAVTASTLLDEEESAKNQFNGYIRKPFSRQELFNELSAFLPAQKTKSSGASEPAPRELLLQLRRLLNERWPGLRDSVAVNESKIFAINLESLGRQFQNQPLIDYAQRMRRDAVNYEVTNLEKRLGEFSSLVEQLERNTRQ